MTYLRVHEPFEQNQFPDARRCLSEVVFGGGSARLLALYESVNKFRYALIY